MDGNGTPDGAAPPSGPQLVVCVGSSAGGLEALKSLLTSLPEDLALTYVIAQHLSPSHTSSLPELLAGSTALPVRVAQDTAALEAGTVLVAGPNVDLTIGPRAVRVTPPGASSGPSPNIDVLMRSAALTWGERAVAVVLSGTGHDGSAGVRAIRNAGGATIVQLPASARFEEMPAAALATGAVDLVVPPDQMGPALRRLALGADGSAGLESPDGILIGGADGADEVTAHGMGGVGAASGADGAPLGWKVAPAQAHHHLEKIVTAVRAHTGIDFAGYKAGTLHRQIERRMGLTQQRGLPDYADLVCADARESHALSAALLVSVTSFFRDPNVWLVLEDRLRAALKTANPLAPVRVWVPGCATGEEVYTAAMIVARLLGNPPDLARRMKIFGTDLSDDALDVARRAAYPSDVVASIPPEFSTQWLERSRTGGWMIKPALRECAVFARHNVAWDPPFPKLNLISMRNTMIYFDVALQARVLRLLHFALAAGGLLLLGEFERIVESHSLFETVEGHEHIYCRRQIRTTGALPSPQVHRDAVAALSVPAPAAALPEDRAGLHEALVRRFTPPSLVIDSEDDVLEVIGEVSRWCWVAQGQHSSHVVALVREELRAPLRSLLLRLRHGDVERVERLVQTGAEPVLMSVSTLEPGNSGRVVVTFGAGRSQGALADVAPAGASAELVADQEGDSAAAQARQLAAALASTEVALQASLEELSTSNEELQALNEELQASAEELQASNEEVQATNEELEATNEELSSRNIDLQQVADQLAATNADLENIQASLSSGLVLVDESLRVTRYSPLAVRVFALIQTDLGRPLTGVPSTQEIPDLERHLLMAVNDSGSTLQLRGERTDVLLQFQPYRRTDGSIRGAIVVSTDITDLTQAHRTARRSLRELTAVTESVREAVWSRDSDGRVLFANSKLESLFGLSRRRVLNDPALLLSVVHPQDRDRVVAVTAAATLARYEVEYRIVRPDGKVRWILESAVGIPADESDPGYVVASALDVTDRHEGAAGAREQAATLEAVFENDVFGVLVLDEANHILRANTFFAALSGYERSALVGMPVQVFYEPRWRSGVLGPGEGAEPPASPGQDLTHQRLVSRGGALHFVTVETMSLEIEAGVSRRIVIIHDITQLHEANAELVSQARFDQQTGLLVRSHFRALLADELERADRSRGSVAVLWIDLDGFKELNDRYGHQAGDIVLQEVAARLRKTGRRHDAVGRLGGDEFAVMVTNVNQVDTLETVAERILTRLREPIQLRDSQVFLTGSMGVALAPEDGSNADALLHNADTAMYSAKQAGRDRRVYFRAEMNEVAQARADMRHQLAAAVRARNFVMYYQPIVELRTGAVRCAEALVRWQREGVIVPAADFVAVAEQTGQLRAIGRVALDLIDLDLRVLASEFGSERVPIAVNLSPAQLEDRDLVDWLLAWAPAGGFEQMIIEVTEAAALARGGRAADTLSVLSRLGAKLSIDDFGVGYSNLAMLDRMRPGIIKIDRSLLVRAQSEPRCRAMLGAAVQLAHALEAEVVIEGVENEGLLSLARELDAGLAQGYQLARPMPLPDLIAWIRERAVTGR